MSIVRGPRPGYEFAMIANELLQDERLSYRARGVASSILSRPDGWRTDAKTLATQGKEGRDAIRVALNELEACGYSCLVRYQNEQGHWVSDRYLFDRTQDMLSFQEQHAARLAA